MPLESTMILLDNSEFMRNGDYVPDRLGAQQDAVTMICRNRTYDNPEATVGTLSMANSRKQGVSLLTAPTRDETKILASFAQLRPDGDLELSTSLQIAQLALLHRTNKNGGQRVIVFIGSPITDKIEVLTQVAKKLRKENIAVSVVVMGDIDENTEKMNAFVEAANSDGNSHLISVPTGVSPSEAVRSSPIMVGSGSGGDGYLGGDSMAGGGAFADTGGVDPEQDPELAAVMRASLEDSRLAEEARAAAEGGGTSEEAPTSATGASTNEATDEDETVVMTQRLTLESPLDRDNAELTGTTNNFDDLDEQAMIEQAIALSMQEVETPNTPAMPPQPPSGREGVDMALGESLIQSLGLSPDDPLIREALAQLPNAPKDKDDDEPDKKKTKDEDK
jgi:26S proteasome regulatory subunit N10